MQADGIFDKYAEASADTIGPDGERTTACSSPRHTSMQKHADAGCADAGSVRCMQRHTHHRPIPLTCLCRCRALLYRPGPGSFRQAGAQQPAPLAWPIFSHQHASVQAVRACALATRSVVCDACTTNLASPIICYIQVLLLAWKMRAKRMGYFSRDEFQSGEGPPADPWSAHRPGE